MTELITRTRYNKKRHLWIVWTEDDGPNEGIYRRKYVLSIKQYNEFIKKPIGGKR